MSTKTEITDIISGKHEMVAHVRSIAAEHRIDLVLGGPHEKGKAYVSTRRVITQPIRSPLGYLIALHELGHILSSKSVEHGNNKPEELLLCEAEAWVWAFENQRLSMDQLTRDKVGYYLHTYHNNALNEARAAADERRATGAPVKPPAFPPEDHIYWTIIGWHKAAEKRKAAAKPKRFLP